ncbi:MAG: hypothetical protein GX661_07000 [Acholeplasmataceae bacterium]|jgi:serine kinase of HPr protein (carbohydrate metabolism regulator)|nr:hypothetical protein [Acholeplasmataceae bacterium]
MGRYRIAGIDLEYITENEVLLKQMEKYRDDACRPHYHMEVRIKPFIEEMPVRPFLVRKNRFLYRKQDRLITDVRKDEKIIIRTEANADYTNVIIELSQALGERLKDMEYLLSGMHFLMMATSANHLSLHASALAYQGEALLFSAPSGTGKSTHARLWQQVFPEAMIINDDKPLLYWEQERFYVSGSPWSGKSILNENIKLPLKAIIFLEQAEKNYLEEISVADKIVYLLRNANRPQEEEFMDLVINNIRKLLLHVPIYRLHCNISEDAVWTVYRKLYQEV